MPQPYPGPEIRGDAMNNTKLATCIKNAALDCGYTHCGMIRVEEMAGYADAIDARITRFPDSEPMYSRLRALALPAQAAPWAKSVIICARWYGKYRIPEGLQGKIGKSFCVDTRRDRRSQEFQDTQRFEGILTGLGITHAVAHDFGITAVRWAAVKAGIGIVRKNNFFYAEHGSWYRLEAFLIDREVELKNTHSLQRCPEKCGLCMKACPTTALSEPFQMNGPVCVSFLTSRETCMPGKKHYDKCGSWIFGCDACQDACPFNRKQWTGAEDFPGLEELAGFLSYERILSLEYETLYSLLPEKFWYIQPDDVWKWKCNVLNAMHNTFESGYLPYIEGAMRDSREEVREMAEWVLESVRRDGRFL